MVTVPSLPFGPTATRQFIDNCVRAVGHSGPSPVVEIAVGQVIQNRTDCSAVEESHDTIALSGLGVREQFMEPSDYSRRKLDRVFPAESGKIQIDAVIDDILFEFDRRTFDVTDFDFIEAGYASEFTRCKICENLRGLDRAG